MSVTEPTIDQQGHEARMSDLAAVDADVIVGPASSIASDTPADESSNRRPMTRRRQLRARTHWRIVQAADASQRVDNDRHLQVELRFNRDVLPVAPAAPRSDMTARRFDPVRTGANDLDRAGAGEPLLGLRDLNGHLVAGQCSLNKHDPTVIEMGDACSPTGDAFNLDRLRLSSVHHRQRTTP